jgi:hypothetical protein
MKTKYVQLFEDRLESLRKLAELGLTDWPQELVDYINGPMTGDLILNQSTIESLPAGLRVGGYLDLSWSSIKTLPADLIVVGDLNLSGSLITELPARLRVGGSLYLYRTQITGLPDDLSVFGHIYGANR